VLALLGVAVMAFGLAAAACTDDDDDGNGEVETPMETPAETPMAGIPEVDITGLDFSFEAPASIEGGVTQINFTNASQVEDHQAQLVRLNEGVTYEDFTAALETAETDADVQDISTFAGGPGNGPGLASSNILDLEVGQYALLCFIPSVSDGVPHFAKGMVQPLEVTESMTEPAVEMPAGDAVIGLSDFAFDAPDTIPAGEISLDAVNNGPQSHELALAQLAEGFTVEDLLALFAGEGAPPESGEPPFIFYGQVAVLSNGLSGQASFNLQAGTYTLLCFVTDPDSGAPHAALGMFKDIVVE
jgi:hypothetical protein